MINYRKAKPADIPTLIQMRLGYMHETHTDLEEPVCVFFLLINKPASPLFITGKTGTLMNVYTLPEYRRRGIGKKLVSMAIEDGKAWDLSYIELRATKCGYPLYKQLDFIEDKSIYMSMKLSFTEE